MLRTLLLAGVALIALGDYSEAQQSRQPGYNRNAFQFAGFSMLQTYATSGNGGGGGGGSSYSGIGDLLYTGGTARAFWGLRAYSSATITASVKALRVCGDGASGDAATSVCADLPVKANGDLDTTAVVGGTVTTNPCFGGSGTCRSPIIYDQVGLLNNTTPNNFVQNTVGSQPIFYVACPFGNTSKPCLGTNGNNASMTATNTTGLLQPLVLNALSYRNNTGSYSYVLSAGNGSGPNIYYRNNDTQFDFDASATNIFTSATSISNRLNSTTMLFNGPSSCAIVNSTTTCGAVSGGSDNFSSTFLLMSYNGGANAYALQGYFVEAFAVTGTPSAPATALAAYNANQKSYWGVPN